MNKSCSAIIPIKEHSERVPGKNFRLFCGKPLYHIILETLLESPSIGRIYVDTDSERIQKEVATLAETIHVIKRPKELEGDNTSVNHIIQYDLTQSDGDLFLQTHCTNPLLSAQTIECAIDTFLAHAAAYDSLFSATRIQTRLYDKAFAPLNHDPKVLLRTQDLDPIFEENSNIYIFSRESFVNNNSNRIGKKPYIFEMGQIESIDIDIEDDFILAEMLYQQRMNRSCQTK